jgi:hypothetical protein
MVMATVLTLAKISGDVYDNFGRDPIDGYRRLASISDFDQINSRGNAFFGAAYIQGEVGVIAFRGSQEWVDWADADVSIACTSLPIDQLGDAFAFFGAARQVLLKRGCKKLMVTGHSLGGGLTQLVAARVTTFPVVGVSFNAPGVAALTGLVKIPSANARGVYNYRAKFDPVSLKGAHIGHSPVSIHGGGMHPLGPLITALSTTLEGGVRH